MGASNIRHEYVISEVPDRKPSSSLAVCEKEGGQVAGELEIPWERDIGGLCFDAAKPAMRSNLCARAALCSQHHKQPLVSKLASDTVPGAQRRSKSSSLSRYFMMFRLILLESTQVTKSSIFLPVLSEKSSKCVESRCD